MVREIAVFQVQEGHGEDFVGAYESVAEILTGAEGNHGASLHRGIEDLSTFTLIVEWDSVDSHTAVTQKPEFKQFGDAIGPHLAGQPQVNHVEAVA